MKMRGKSAPTDFRSFPLEQDGHCQRDRRLREKYCCLRTELTETDHALRSLAFRLADMTVSEKPSGKPSAPIISLADHPRRVS
jgi:hypothetical protein